ncbi:hypothetical protein RvY_06093 [Ramazzottius varieornatus]|uniref:Uncharacterized protein n=1 Tax=Ramazzottius varieornatus TaxID=947166 RepID=A0A1D1V704_RAMVA|nr:hypothetical protein RvY_06089 [Ramazzottius varieornatus]GAU94293.1 hypothetical protein RvY_06093 [Ramazzottius varieornatus]
MAAYYPPPPYTASAPVVVAACPCTASMYGECSICHAPNCACGMHRCVHINPMGTALGVAALLSIPLLLRSTAGLLYHPRLPYYGYGPGFLHRGPVVVNRGPVVVHRGPTVVHRDVGFGGHHGGFGGHHGGHHGGGGRHH